MEQGYLIDTNVVIDYMGERLPGPALDFIDTVLNGTFFLSVINKIDLLGFENLSAKEERQFHDLINTSNIISLHDGIIEETIALRRMYSIKLPDAIIAASAITINATLITSDLAGFRKVSALKLLDPHTIKK